jgi:hypothetical protein
MPTIRVAADEVMTITAAPGAWGTVGQHESRSHWHVGPTSPLTVGPGLYFISDTLTCNTTSRAVAALAATLPRATQLVRSQRILTMALADKMKNLAARAKAVPAALSDRADAAFARLDNVERRGDHAFAGFDSVLTDVETGIVAAEDALAQLTNGAPVDPN